MTKEQISPVTLCSVALFLKIDGIDSLSLLFTKERREQIAPIALYKRATVSESIPSIFKKATGAICFFFTSESIVSSRKTSDSLKKLIIEFPTLTYVEIHKKYNNLFCITPHPLLPYCSQRHLSNQLDGRDINDTINMIFEEVNFDMF